MSVSPSAKWGDDSSTPRAAASVPTHSGPNSSQLVAGTPRAFAVTVVSSSTCPVKGGSACRPTAGRKPEWAGWKRARGPDETGRWCFSQSHRREGQVHVTAGEVGETKKGNNRDMFLSALFFLLPTFPSRLGPSILTVRFAGHQQGSWLGVSSLDRCRSSPSILCKSPVDQWGSWRRGRR